MDQIPERIESLQSRMSGAESLIKDLRTTIQQLQYIVIKLAELDRSIDENWLKEHREEYE